MLILPLHFFNIGDLIFRFKCYIFRMKFSGKIFFGGQLITATSHDAINTAEVTKFVCC